MDWQIKEIVRKDAVKISNWQYDAPYSLYNMQGARDSINELLDGGSFGVFDKEGTLFGYFCFGPSARVPAGCSSGAYDRRNLVDIGLGLRPDLCGQGLGHSFLKAGMDFAARRFGQHTFRLTVAAFNERAVRVYERSGFKKTHTFTRNTEKDSVVFFVMVREAPANENSV